MLTKIQEQQLKDRIQRVLHAPGNDIRSTPEMAVVFDRELEKEEAAGYGRGIGLLLKSMGDIFRNVRLNLVWWEGEEGNRHEISAIAHLITGRAFEGYEAMEKEKTLEGLCRELKLFQARSRLILLVSAGNYRIADEEKLRENLNPFLYRRLILISPEGIAQRSGKEH